jgi:hypothetical protein
MRESIGLLPADEFETFVFTMVEYNRIKVNDHEVKINGRMYDHSTPKFEQGKVVLHARHDEAEDSLIGFLKEVVSTATSDEQRAPNELTNFFSLDFIIQPSLLLNLNALRSKIQRSPQEKPESEILTIESPPPKV